MWNETDHPLAYLITFRFCGTWLHGDERGSIDRFHNQYQSPLIAPNKKWKEYNLQKMKRDIVIFGQEQRKIIKDAICETCEIRRWTLHAVNVRTNHVHAVVTTGLTKPESALNAFKANATRKMREFNCWKSDKSPWADKGSKRYLWNDRSLQAAKDYVLYAQGGDLPDLS